MSSKLEKLIEGYLNSVIKIKLDNFKYIKVDIIPNQYSSKDVEITFIMEKPFEEQDARYIRRENIKQEINDILKKFFNLDFRNIQIAISTESIYQKYKKGYFDRVKGFDVEKKGISELKKLNDLILSEASKKQILLDKIGFNEDNADILDKLSGPLAVWMGNKFIDYYQQYYGGLTNELSPDELKIATINKINDDVIVYRNRQKIGEIMDWVRVGLNGNLGEYKDLTLDKLIEKSKEWHDSLEVGQGEINYDEKNHILLDFRDDDGNGFYWADLDTKNSPEECDRMGHCGRSHYGYLYSLRQVIPLNKKYKLNKSVLTAAIGTDGILYQLKGPKNSKPEDKYHQYILPLFYVLGGGGEEDDYLIQGFGSEYASEQDFKLSDLPEETIKELYQNRPELFDSRRMQRLLGKMGIIEVEPLPTGFTLEIRPDDIEDYLDGGWYNTYTNRNTGEKRKVSIFEEIMEGDAWNLWNSDGYEDISSYFQYVIDDETAEEIWNIVKQMSEKNGIELEDGLSLEEAINEVDDNWEIRNAISGGMNDADADDYLNYLQDQIKSALEEYGNVYEFNYDGVKIQIDLNDLVDLDNDEIDEIFEDYTEKGGRYNFGGILRELIYQDYIDKPKFNYDDRWYPSPDSDVVNENVRMRLGDISI